MSCSAHKIYKLHYGKYVMEEYKDSSEIALEEFIVKKKKERRGRGEKNKNFKYQRAQLTQNRNMRKYFLSYFLIYKFMHPLQLGLRKNHQVYLSTHCTIYILQTILH